MKPPVLQISNISKTFLGNRVLSEVSLDIDEGEVLALVGHNGSGKSTLAKILSGFYEPDEGGAILCGSTPLELGEPNHAKAAGLRFVHQQARLIDTMTVSDNIALSLGSETTRTGRIRRGRERDRARRLMADVGLQCGPDQIVASLNPTERTLVALARAVAVDEDPVRVVVLDEVTATLSFRETMQVFSSIKTLRKQGIAILYISHHLAEVLELADRVAALRNGKLVTVTDAKRITREELADFVTADPEQVDTAPARVAQRPSEVRTPDISAPQANDGTASVLAVHDLRGTFLDGVTFEVRPGSVIGFAGVSGSGRDELASMLVGHTESIGRIAVGGNVLAKMRPDRSASAGVRLVPAERLRHALFPELPVSHNIGISTFRSSWNGWRIIRRRELAEVKGWLLRLHLDETTHDKQMQILSGGMQQKCIIARVLRTDLSVLILDEPTQGVDIHTKTEIYRLVAETAQRGVAVVICSSDSEDLCEMCDEVWILAHGKISSRHVVNDGITPAQLDALQLRA